MLPWTKSTDSISFDSSAELLCSSKLDSFLSVSSCPWLTQGTVMVATELQTSNEPSTDNMPGITTQPDRENGRKSDTVKSEQEQQAPGLLQVNQPTVSRVTTPDKKLADKIRFSWESSQETADSDGDTASETSSLSSMSSLTSQSSQSTLHKDTKGAKWITRDGEYDLDRAKTCKLSFIQQYNTEDAALNLASEISNALNKDFVLTNQQRFKVELSRSSVTNRTDVSITGSKKKKKVSELHVNLEDDLELCKIVKNCQERTSKAIGEVFGLNVEFDKTTIQRFDSTAHSTAYENEDPDSQGGPFSPTVAILTIGPDLGRPMFLRTKAGSVVTHKITLRSGSLCILSGRSEVRYKRAIPKDYGEDGEHYFITMVQKKPEDSILEVLKTIPIPKGESTNQICVSQSTSAGESEDTVRFGVVTNDDFQEKETAPEVKTRPSPVLNTPPTVIRRGSMIFENGKPLFKDLPQYEPDGGLLLTETVGAAVDRMDDNTVTVELMRSGCPTEGSLVDKRRRLQNKICLSLGEMSAANMNSSINLLKNASPECDNTTTGLLHDEIGNLNETFSNSQKCIEGTLKMVVDNIVEMKSEISSIKRTTLTTANNSINNIGSNLIREEEDKIGKCLSETGSHIRTLSNEVNRCSEKVEDLLESVDKITQNLKRTSEEMTELKENASDILRRAVDDMQNYCTSVFADESREHVKRIYDIVVDAYNTLPDSTSDHQEEEILNSEQDGNEDDGDDEGGEEEKPAAVEETQPRPSPGFNFPVRLSPSLQKAIKSYHKIEVLLITDSIMRHITENDMCFGEKYRVNFTRVDRTSTKDLAHRKLLELISTTKPHVVYVHLGVNDIQQGEDPMEAVRNLEDFDKRMKEISPSTHLIISSPLLNGNSYHCRNISTIRRSLMLYLHKQEVYSDYRQSRLRIQPNNHFLIDPYVEKRRQNPRYFLNNDPLHLSPLGKRAIISTMRDALHSVFKQQKEQLC